MKLNGITRSKFAKSARLASLAVSCVALLSACGGGGNSDPAPAPVAQHVTDNLAQRAAATAYLGGPASLYAPSGLLFTTIAGLLSPDPTTGVIYYATTPTPLNLNGVCNLAGGTMSLQINDAGSDQKFTAGDSAVMSFGNCALNLDGLNVTLTGSLTMTVQPTTRGADIVSTFYFAPQNLSANLQGVAATYSGLAGIEYVFPGGFIGQGAVANIAYVSDRIALNFAGTRSDIITNMNWPVASVLTNTSPLTYSPKHTLTLQEFGYTDTFYTSTLSPVQYQGGNVKAFITGQINHAHAVDTVLSTITATNTSRIDVDYFGNGTSDRIINDTVSGLVNSFH
jgi:hypothetical protein